ncbi:Glutaredoxin family protein [Rhynchospora pubera]|uniref:Glutaredoxin family protein n=1 Tax=Rhynchospora pubera TaxID=906938 RepID=A0AAV8CPB6_9POAL|nr:Glutaredoxin family protein [Rhynchospora pubera]
MLRRLLRSSLTIAAPSMRLQEKILAPSMDGKVAVGLAMNRLMNYSSGPAAGDSPGSRVAEDSATHEDFQPTVKSSGFSLEDIVHQDVKENPVMIYMKGVPDAPRCGFSALAVKVLQQYGVPIGARDILSDLQLKESVKSFSKWPTFPQIFIKGDFVGGSDIILSMHQKGELKDLLADISSERKEADA